MFCQVLGATSKNLSGVDLSINKLHSQLENSRLEESAELFQQLKCNHLLCCCKTVFSIAVMGLDTRDPLDLTLHKA